MLERASAVMKSHYEGGRRGLILLNTYYVGTMWEYRVYASLCQFSQKLYRRSMLFKNYHNLLFTNQKAEADGLEIDWDYTTRQNNKNKA